MLDQTHIGRLGALLFAWTSGGDCGHTNKKPNNDESTNESSLKRPQLGTPWPIPACNTCGGRAVVSSVSGTVSDASIFFIFYFFRAFNLAPKNSKRKLHAIDWVNGHVSGGMECQTMHAGNLRKLVRLAG